MSINDHPAVMLPDASFLLSGTFEKSGFDLIITNQAGETHIVYDYFAFDPPPNLMLAGGAGFSPEMVMHKLHLPFGEDVMFAGPANAATNQIEIGKVTLLLGTVTVKRLDANGDVIEVRLSRGDKLYQGDEISTGGRAFIKAQMLDGTRFHLGKNANAVLTDFAFNEEAKTGNFEAFVTRGGFHYKSGKIGKMLADASKNHSTISTPTAIIGIRGSELDGNVDPTTGNTVVVHRSGILSVTDINGQNGVVLDSSGNTSSITFNGLPSKTEFPSPQELDSLTQNLPPPDTPQELLDDGAGEEDPGPEDDVPGEEPNAEDERPAEGDRPPEGEPEGEEEPSAEGEEPSAEGEEPSAEGDREPSAEGEEPSAEGNREPSAEGNDAPPDQREPQAAEDADPEAAGDNNDNRPGQAAAEPRASEGEPDSSGGDDGNQGENNAPASTAQQRPQQTAAGDDTPSGVTIRESSFQNASTEVVGGQAGTQTGTGNDGSGTSGTGTRAGDNADSTGELETLGIPTGEKKATTETQKNEPEPVTEELPPDNPPVARNDFLTVSEADEIEITAFLLSNDTDGDPGQSPRLLQVAANGDLGGQLKFDGSVVLYVPNSGALNTLRGGETATETFSYRVKSGDLTDTATLTVRLVGTNTAPVANDDRGQTVEDSPLALNVLANDADPDGDALRIVNVDNASAQGTVTIAADGRGLVYNPPDSLPSGAVAQDVFKYQVSDGQFTDTATVTISVTGKNDPPVINTEGEPFAVSAGSGPTVIPLNVIFADADLGAELEVVSIDTTGTTGIVTIGSIIYDDGGRFRFLGEGEKLSDSFGVTVVDENGATGSGRYTLEIVGVNDAPEAQADAYSALPDQAFNVPAAVGLLSNDTDIDGDSLRVNTTPLVGPANGSLLLGAGGAFSYTPDTGFSGADSFVYEVFDSFGAVSSATVTLTVSDSVAAPVAVADVYTVSVDGVLNGNVLGNDFDPGDEPLFVSLAGNTQNGTVGLLPSGLFDYTPNAGFSGVDSFTYTLTNASGQTDTATVSLTVSGVNLAPSALPIGTRELPASEVSSVDLNNFFNDPEGGELLFDFSSSAPFISLNGSVLSVFPPAAALGASFTVEVGASDGENITTTVFTIDVIDANLPPDLILPLNDQVLLVGGTVNANVSGRFSDPDGDPLTFSLTTDAPFLTLSGSNLQGITNAGSAGTYSVTIGASDGKATTTSTFTLTVNSPPPNAPTIVVSGDSSTVTNTSTVSIISDSLVVTDSDGLAPLPFVVSAQGANGTATIDPSTGDWDYIPTNTSFVGTDSFTVTVTDALGATTPVPIDLIIRPLDTPTVFASGFSGTGTEDMTLTNNLIALDSDLVNPNPFAIASQSANGVANINSATGQWIYTPAPDFAGNDSFIVSFTDGYNYVQTQTIFVNINPVNDQTPVADDESFTITEGGTATAANLDAGLTLLDGDTDADLPGDTLQAFVLSGPGHDGGSLVLNTDGTFTYTHDGSENHTDSFTYHVFDGANTDTGTVTITITPVNDNAPVPDNESFSIVKGGTATESALNAGLNLLDGDTDADLPGDTLTVVANSTSTSFGNVTIATDGTFSYTHDGSENFTDSFTYQVTDGVFTSTATVNVTITAAPNNPPTGSPVITGSSEVGQVLSAVTSGIADADGLGSFTYEWFADGVSVFGPTSTANYTTTPTDVNKELKVEVAYSDGASNNELIQSSSVFVGAQSPLVSGTQNYTLIPGVDDFVIGTDGVEDLTLIGNAELGDFVDLGGGSDTLTLTGANNVIGVESVETILSSGADTITIEGDLFALTGILSNRSPADVVIVDGDVLLFDEVIGSTAGDFQVANNGYLEIGGSSGSQIVFDSFSVNDGNVVLDGSATSRITVSSGSLVNNHEFTSGGSPGTPHEFDGSFVNSAGGHLHVEKDLTFVSGSTLDVRTNTNDVFVESGQTLDFDNSTLHVNLNTSFIGQGDILLSNGAILLVDTNYRHEAGSPQLNFDGTSFINGGNFLLDQGANLTLMGDTINSSNFNVSGFLTLDGGGVTAFSGSVLINPTAQVTLDSSIASGSAQPTIGGLLDNSGVITLDNSDGSAAATSSLIVSGPGFTNQVNGVIESVDDDLSLTGTNRHTIDANLNNAGRIEVAADLELNRISGAHISNGQIELAGGDLYVSNATSFTNLPGGRIFGEGTVNINTPLIQQGILEPTSMVPIGATISIIGDLDLDASSTIDLDIFNAVGSHDVVTVSGQLDVEGSLNINFVTIAGLESGGTIQNVLQFTSLGPNTTFAPMNVQHNLGSAYTVTAVNDGTAFDLLVVPSFNREFTDGGSGSDWITPGNWTTSTVPGSLDDALISGFNVDHDSTDTNLVGSLTLVNSTLTITDGSVELLKGSRVDSLSTITITNGPGTAGTLGVTETLVVEGTLDFTEGSITSTTTTSLINTVGPSSVFNIATGPTTFLNVDVRNDGGTINIFGSGFLQAPSNKIENNGILIVDASPAIDAALDNNGQLFVGSGTAIASVSFNQFTQNLHSGTFNIDTPGSFNTNVILDNTFFRNFGTINLLDSGASGGFRTWDLGGNGNFLDNQGTINVFADTLIDIENASLITDQGGFILSPGVNLTIDGGSSGSSFQLGASTFFAGSGNLNLVNNVEINLVDDFFLNSGSVFIDTSAGNVTFTNNSLTIGNTSSLGLNPGDVVNSDLFNIGTLTLTTDVTSNDISIKGQFANLGTLQINSATGSGAKVFDFGFENNGNLIMSTATLDNNVLEVGDVGTATLTNNNFFQSDNSSPASVPNTFRGTLVNNGSLQVDYDLDLAELAVPVQHDNFGFIFINASATLKLGANNDLFNHEGGVIAGGGLLDVASSNVDFNNNGLILPGGQSTTNVLTINNNANTVFGPESEVEIDLNGLVAGASYDQLAFIGGVAPQLGGRLNVNLVSGFTPVNLNVFTIMTSVAALGTSFTQIEGTDLFADEGIVFLVDQTAGSMTLTARAPTIPGAAIDDVLFATISPDVIHGGDGNDRINDISSGDTAFGGEGNDFFVADSTFGRIVGGEGIDSLRLTDAVQDFRPGADSGYRVEEIEVLDYADGFAQTLTLDDASIRVIVDGGNAVLGLENAIVFFGDPNDLVLLDGDFFETGTDVLDLRTPGVFESFTVLQDSSSGSYFAFGEEARVDVTKLSGAKLVYGSSADDNIAGTIGADELRGRDGNDVIDGGGNSDLIAGGEGNDAISFDAIDVAQGGPGIDKLFDDSVGATIDLTGLTNFSGIEAFDMRDADPTDTLIIGADDIASILGAENGLDAILPDGRLKFVVTGDAGDSLSLDGNLIHTAMSTGSLVGGWTAPNGAAESDYLSNGTNYLKLSNGSIDIYIHEDVSNVV